MRIQQSFSHHFVFWVLVCSLFGPPASAQTITKVADLSSTTGSGLTPLIQGLDGNLYAAASTGGSVSAGTFIKVALSGTVSVVHNFCSTSTCADGSNPQGNIGLGPDGSFYGTTPFNGYLGNGNYGKGVVYRLRPDGTLSVLHTFCRYYGCPDGGTPRFGVTLAWNGNLYGISGGDGLAGDTSQSVVFRVSPSGVFGRLLVVCPNSVCPTNAGPNGFLTQANGGYLIGPGPGGIYNAGAIYRMTPSGTTSIIYSFCPDSTCHEGFLTNTPIVQGASGAIYGTNLKGGSGFYCPNLPGNCGTAFRLDPADGGILKTLHEFCNWNGCSDGGWPEGPMIQASDGNFYGTTAVNVWYGDGLIYKLTPTGEYSVVYDGEQANLGCEPTGALVQHTDGDLYGTMHACGANDVGTIIRISLGLPPFVKVVQNAGLAGATAVILGSNLTGSTQVTFNGTSAAFTVVSETEITATVPASATTGKIQVVTPAATLSSLEPFVVRH